MHTIKVCTKCQVEKSIDEFRNYKRSKDGKVPWCKPCFKEHEKQHWKNSPERRQRSKDRNREAIKRNRQFIFSYLLEHPCENCSENDPVVLEFDHLDTKTKKFAVSEMYNTGLETLKEEIAKCRVLCANCHRRHTAKQQNWWIAEQIKSSQSCP